MRLIDLFEAPIKTTVPVGDKMDAISDLQNDGAKYLGGGGWGQVYNHPNKDVEHATKVTDIGAGWKLDGYFNYIKSIRRLSNENQNPYAPQIYSITKSTPKDGRPYLVVGIEQLYEGTSFEADELALMILKILDISMLTGTEEDTWNTESRWDSIQKQFSDNISYRPFPGTTKNNLFLLAVLMQGTIKGKKYKYPIKDKQLLQVLGIIKNLHKKGFELDFQTVNFMFRRTQYGPQMVLTDPISYFDSQLVRLKPMSPQEWKTS